MYHGCWVMVCYCFVLFVPVYFSDDVAEQPTPDSYKRVGRETSKNGEHKNEDTHTQKVLETWQSVRVEELQNANVILQEYIKLIEEHIALRKEFLTLKNYLGLVDK